MKIFLTIDDISKQELLDIFDTTKMLKKDPLLKKEALNQKVIALIFEKPSSRTRVSFEVGAAQLGATSLYLGAEDVKFGKREPIKDMARTLSRYVQMVVLRTYSHKDIVDFTASAGIPVINGLSDLYHPCQAMGDIFTMLELIKHPNDITLCYVGDGYNVLNSLLTGCSKIGINITISTPKGYEPSKKIIKKSKDYGQKSGSTVEFYYDPKKAVNNADFVYTDVWTSMGQEKEINKRKKDFKGYQLDEKLLKSAKNKTYIMHCLPAHRGEEITEKVIESKNSIIFEQAENRLHVQKAIMLKLLAE